MAYKCMGLVVMPGGFGSLDELFEMLVLLQTKYLGKAVCNLWVVLAHEMGEAGGSW